MDWQNLFSPQLWGTFAPYLVVNLLLAAVFGWIGGWLSHRWTSKRDEKNWERDFKAERLRTSEQKLEQMKSQIGRSVQSLPEAIGHAQADATEKALITLAGEMHLALHPVDGIPDIAPRLSVLYRSFLMALIELDTDPTPAIAKLSTGLQSAYSYSLFVSREDISHLMQLVQDAWELRQQIKRLQQDLGITVP